MGEYVFNRHVDRIKVEGIRVCIVIEALAVGPAAVMDETQGVASGFRNSRQGANNPRFSLGNPIVSRCDFLF